MLSKKALFTLSGIAILISSNISAQESCTPNYGNQLQSLSICNSWEEHNRAGITVAPSSGWTVIANTGSSSTGSNTITHSYCLTLTYSNPNSYPSQSVFDLAIVDPHGSQNPSFSGTCTMYFNQCTAPGGMPGFSATVVGCTSGIPTLKACYGGISGPQNNGHLSLGATCT
ncbi:hypothetical protein BN59_01281 [Legionella massiliensis]|uniref:Secreted protein n=1 Tax=Legionella massiliensis TaxID=1034943 RepID=A0A078KVH8_9GAMM|nr:hypothetical protein [Legionella massiliensis]CDZ77002.1 hypothetical protein BN59_01281 [Legionella massiliensis]CEE12740.1 hypothetical protein BN1094_01281 [Legionella massiliensis]